MIIFLSVFILIVTVFALIFAIRVRPDPRLFWTISTLGVSLAWLSLFYLRLQMPLALSKIVWQLDGSPAIRFDWRLDETAWFLAFAFLAFLLIFLLVEVQNFLEISPRKWLEILGVMTIVNISALSGNFLTLAFSWGLIDIFAITHAMRNQKNVDAMRYLQIAAPANLISIVILLWVSIAQTTPLFYIGSASINSLLLLILAIRLGLILPRLEKYPQSSDFLAGTGFFRLASLLPSLVLVPQIESPIVGGGLILLWLLISIAAIRGVKWFVAKDFEDAYPYFLLLAFSLSLILASQALYAGALALILFTLLFAGLLPLIAHIAPYKAAILFVGLWAFSTLPFSPLKAVSQIYTRGPFSMAIVFAFLQTLLLAGWIKHSGVLKERSVYLENWQRNIFFSAFALGLIILIALAFGLLPNLAALDTPFSIWPLAPLAFSFILAFAAPKRLLTPIAQFFQNIETFLSFDLFYIALSRISSAISRSLKLLSNLLEGSAGVLWALLLIALMLSLIGQSGFSG